MLVAPEQLEAVATLVQEDSLDLLGLLVHVVKMDLLARSDNLDQTELLVSVVLRVRAFADVMVTIMMSA